MKSISVYLLIGSVALTAAVMLFDAVPLGVPGEWTWQRHEHAADALDLLDRLLPAILGGALFVGVAWWGLQRIHRADRKTTALLYALLIPAGFCWMYAVQKSTPVGYRDVKPSWVLYDPASSGYFFEAAFRMTSPSEFLSGYEERMNEGDVLHVGTHPPGLFLLSRFCLSACRSSPTLTDLVLSLQSRHERQAFRLLESSSLLAHPLRDSDLAALHLLSLLTDSAMVLTIIPLAFLAGQFFKSATVWKICCLWPCLPCLATFLPKSDLLFPLTGTVVVALMVSAMRKDGRWLLAVAAGVVLWCGLLLSLAHLPVLFLLAALATSRAIQTNGSSLRRDASMMAVLLAAVAVTATAWYVATDCNLLRVWYLNLTNHEGFYGQFSRTWWKWLLVNPLELVFAVGAPASLLIGAGCWRAWKTCGDESSPDTRNAVAFCSAVAATWIALWLSGKNQGEAARLWCFLTPWLLVASGFMLDRDEAASSLPSFTKLIALQLVAAVLTVSQVAGFNFGRDLPPSTVAADEQSGP